MSETLAIVLAGDRGEGLAPLTNRRAKAAVPFGGEYRLIDFPLTNCLRSGLRHVLVTTENKSHPLLRHLRDGWSIFNPALGEYVMPVPAESTGDGAGRHGATEALRQCRDMVARSDARTVLVLPGHHVYRMDYAALVEYHDEHGFDLTIGCLEASRHRLDGFQTVVVGDDGRVTTLSPPDSAPAGRELLSMRVYAFARETLLDALASATGGDLDLELVPGIVGAHRVGAYRFGGRAGRVSQDRFFSPVDTVDEYFAANMALLEPVPPLDLYQDSWTIWSSTGKHPPARTVSSASGNEGIFVNSIVSNGTVITGGVVSRSVLCPQVRVQDSASVEESILFDGVVVGEGAQLRRCIVDKQVVIERGDRIGFDAREDARRFHVTDTGIVVVPAA
ncbi:MAG: glucose-1-phosphate adenylyltransferase [Ectothiorhodospiraceae bacterium]|nr:glucose-1-phosphate adenylyltransferase [Chromatiales bacterium]MCP5156706.1 glucose-1-phosphate adenylyltransferase [Ectothiorhodospiraceae bacterium]